MIEGRYHFATPRVTRDVLTLFNGITLWICILQLSVAIERESTIFFAPHIGTHSGETSASQHSRKDKVGLWINFDETVCSNCPVAVLNVPIKAMASGISEVGNAGSQSIWILFSGFTPILQCIVSSCVTKVRLPHLNLMVIFPLEFFLRFLFRKLPNDATWTSSRKWRRIDHSWIKKWTRKFFKDKYDSNLLRLFHVSEK